MAKAGGTRRFHVHELWRIQDVPDACSTCSAVLHIVILLCQVPRQEKRNHKIERKKKVETAGPSSGNNLRIGHWTLSLCIPHLFAVSQLEKKAKTKPKQCYPTFAVMNLKYFSEISVTQKFRVPQLSAISPAPCDIQCVNLQ